jgi:hypothetical protein
MSETESPNETLKSAKLRKEMRPLTEQEASSLRQNSKPSKAKRVLLAPLPGFTYNPLLKLPRNSPCPCRSDKKFKACCLSTLPQVVPTADAEKFAEAMKRPNLTFVTKENEATMRVAQDMRSYFGEQERLKAEQERKERAKSYATEPGPEVG